MSDGMELFTSVKQTLKNREELILKLNREHELISELCRNLLSSLSSSMRGNGMTYDEKKEIKGHTKDLCSRIDSEVKIQIHCQEELMRIESEDYGKVQGVSCSVVGSGHNTKED